MADTNKRIDVHTHILPDFYVSYLAKVGYSGGAGARGRAFPEWHAETHLEVMDRNGIQTALTSVTAPGVYFGDKVAAADMARQCNRFSAQLKQDHPGRFGSFAVLPLPDVESSIREIKYALEELKLEGVTLLASVGNQYLGEAAFNPVFEELNRQKAMVLIHPTTPPGRESLDLASPDFAVEFIFDTTRAVANLYFSGTLGRFPDIRYIVSHAGGAIPYLAYRMQLGWLGMGDQSLQDPVECLKNLYYDTALSASPFNLRSLQELADPAHIVYGTDYPFAPETVTQMTNQGLQSYDGFDDESLSLIQHDNITALLPGL